MTEEKTAPSILTFNNQLLRIKADVTPTLCREAESFIPYYIEKVQTKFAGLKAKGQVAGYMVYEDFFTRSWNAFKSATTLDPNYKVSFYLGQGRQDIDGLDFQVNVNERRLGFLSLPADPQVYAHFPFEWLKVFVDEKLAEENISERVNPAHLYLAYRRASQGHVTQNVSIHQKPVIPAGQSVQFKFIADLARGEVSLVIFDLHSLLQPERFAKFIRGVKNQLNLISQKENKNYIFLEEYLSTHLHSGLQGPKVLGLGLPLCVLIGVDADLERQVPVLNNAEMKKNEPQHHQPQAHQQVHSAPTGHQAHHQPHSKNHSPAKTASNHSHKATPNIDSPLIPLLNRYVEIEIAEDNLSAQINNFNEEFYQKHEGIVPADVFQTFLASKGVVSGVGQHLIAAITQGITQKKNLANMSVAIGKAPRVAKQGYLFPHFEFALAEKEKKKDSETINMRETQKAMVVSEGDLIAETRYKEPEQIGLDVRGNMIDPPPPEAFKVNVGENIIEKEPGKYYAAADGMPVVKHNYVMLRKGLMIEGNVNLATGNVHFTGDVEIKGSVDTGSLVETTGDLTIYGKLCSGDIKVGGNLVVKEGIITDGKATIRVKGDLMADFMENSCVNVKGNIEIVRTIINSTVVCGGEITLKNADSIITGGKIYSRGSVNTANIGLKRGAVTQIYVGIDSVIEDRIERLEARLRRITAYQEETRLALREMTGRKGLAHNQLEEKKEEFREKLVQCRRIQEKVESFITQCKALRTYNTEARILVPNQLMGHTKIEFCGKGVILGQDYAGVAIKSSESSQRNAKVVPIEDVIRKDRAS